MHVSLTETLDKYVRDQVATGLYNNASEVIRDALRLKIRAEQTEAEKFAALKRDIDEAWEESERGDTVELDMHEFIGELDRSPKSIT